MVNLTEDPITWFAEKSGIHKTIVKKYFEELEKSGVDWQNLDIETIADEIRDFGQTGGLLEHPELRRRFGLSPVVEKTAEIEAIEDEIESLLGDKHGVKNLLRRVYADPKLSNKMKDELKEKIISGAPEMTTLIALYDGEEKDYAKELLKEMVLSPTSDIRDLLKGDTLKVKSSRGWIKEINDIPLEKPLRSIDLVPLVADYKIIASQPEKEYTIAVYSKKEPEIVIPLKPVVPVSAKELEMGIKVEMEHTKDPAIAERIARDHLAEISDYYTRLIKMEKEAKPVVKPSAEEFVIPESRTAMGGKPLATREYCYRCGREAKTDQFSKQVNGHTVYFCSELCFYADKQPQKVIPKFGIGQTVSQETISEIRSKAFVKPLESDFEKQVERLKSEGKLRPQVKYGQIRWQYLEKDGIFTIAPDLKTAVERALIKEPKVTTAELVASVEKSYDKRAEELSLGYGYADIKKLGDQHNLRLKGSKVEMLIELLKHNVL